QSKNSFVPTIPNESREFGNFVSSNFSMYVNTDLAREYNKLFHTIQLEAIFNIPYYTFKNGLFSQNMYALSAQALNSYTSPLLRDYDYQGRLYDSVWNPSSILPINASNKRTTGFLYPEFGTSNLDGFIYLQPFYLAPKNSWDMTFTPQIRYKRGFGLNFEARYINSKNDRFLFNAR
ncbi:LPS assembly protein LptD, partial [Helicobacter pylori]|uniref:LPS assembly protein LptD n=1 Tax=Helicobacter pylori TaxID=210 RepID=UPI001F52FD81